MIRQFVEVPATMTLRDQLRGHQSDLPNEVVGRLFRMRHVAVWHHDLEKRKSGEPYHEHCLSVEDIVRQVLARCPFCVSSPYGEVEQQAACGHDLFEACIEHGDVDTVRADLEKYFSGRVIMLIEALTKYDPDTYWEQLLLANSQDPWVVIIKIADRLHNLVTIRGFGLEKQLEYLEETQGPLLEMCYRAHQWVRERAPVFDSVYDGLITQLQGTARDVLVRVRAELCLTMSFA